MTNGNKETLDENNFHDDFFKTWNETPVFSMDDDIE